MTRCNSEWRPVAIGKDSYSVMNADAELTVYDIGGSGEGGSRGFNATVSIYGNMLLRDQRTRISWLVRSVHMADNRGSRRPHPFVFYQLKERMLFNSPVPHTHHTIHPTRSAHLRRPHKNLVYPPLYSSHGTDGWRGGSYGSESICGAGSAEHDRQYREGSAGARKEHMGPTAARGRSRLSPLRRPRRRPQVALAQAAHA